ncbi:hypothetical protein [Pedobacter sp. UBA5917]|jgi:hypothetical protein|uniref:hypothetical protein n=1 Tax=Pedobacter sp. UBA5917 TaxID=1947061 RepID=UPI0025F383FB|nr:hypothetical protein [Pedobacter sp. UBA5917]
MKKIVLAFLLLTGGLALHAQTYQPVTSKNKTYLETVKGLSYTYKNGIVTLKNNGKYNLGTVSIIASSKTDANLFGIALFEDGLEKGHTQQASVYFTTGKDNHEVALTAIDQKSLVLSFDKAVRAVN